MAVEVGWRGHVWENGRSHWATDCCVHFLTTALVHNKPPPFRIATKWLPITTKNVLATMWLFSNGTFVPQTCVAIEMCVAISPVAIAYVVITHFVIYMLQFYWLSFSECTNSCCNFQCCNQQNDIIKVTISVLQFPLLQFPLLQLPVLQLCWCGSQATELTIEAC